MDRQPLQSLADSALNRLVGSPLRRGSPEDKADFDRENGPVRKRPRNDDDKRDIIRSDRVEDGVARVERLPKLPPSRSLPARLLHREIQGIPQIYRQTKFSTRFRLGDFACGENDYYQVTEEGGYLVPPYVCKYSQTNSGLLGVVDEQGAVNFVDTTPGVSPDQRLKSRFIAHDNAAFDGAWMDNDKSFVTVAGDGTAALWDVESHAAKAILKGHSATLKTVSVCPTDPNIIATGSRAGDILIHDVRCSSSKIFDPDPEATPTYNRVNMIQNAHLPAGAKRSRSGIGSVTQVLFLGQGSYQLASTGASDGVVKIWDVRKHGSYIKYTDPTPIACSAQVSDTLRSRGFTSLAVDPSGSKLFAGSTDNRIYMFVTKNIGEPFATFSEPSFTSIGNAFFIRSAVSPDGRYIASGSSSGSVYIWEVAHPERPAYLLSAHRAECSSVSWCPSGTEQLASCSDDATVRIWRMDRELVNETKRDPETMRKTSVAFEGKIASPAERRKAKIVPKSGPTTPVTPSVPRRDLRSYFTTPTPTSRLDSSSSPQARSATVVRSPRRHRTGDENAPVANGTHGR